MTSFQVLPKTPHAAGVRIFFRCNPQHCLEGALQMKRALPKFRTQARQRDWFIEMLLNIAGHRLDQFLSRISDYRFGTAAQQEGRQYTPVDDTANTNFPSLAPSRASTACQRWSSTIGVICVRSRSTDSRFSIALFMIAGYGRHEIRAIRILRSN